MTHPRFGSAHKRHQSRMYEYGMLDDKGRPLNSPITDLAFTTNGVGIGSITETLQSVGLGPNERKPLNASRTAEDGIPDKAVTREDVFPGYQDSWINNREWRLPKEERLPERLLDYFQDIPVRMAYVKDPSHFYVIRDDEYKECRTYCQKVGSAMSMGSEIYRPGSRNNLIALKGSDLDTWRRLEVLEYLPHQLAYVRFIDDGETATFNIPSFDIRTLDASYKDEPGYAILCSLDVKPIGDTWPETVLRTLKEDLLGQVVKVRCIFQTRGFHVTHIVKMFLPESDTDFGTTLVEVGLAKKRTDIPTYN